MHRHFSRLQLGICLLACGVLSARAAAPRLHQDVLVFVPAYEACQLWDATLDDASDPTCVWGNLNVFFSSRRYFALREPNPLQARTMRSFGPVDIYGRFLSTLTRPNASMPGFSPYTLGADFFIFNYDWRQDIALSARQLDENLKEYASAHARQTGLPANQTRFILVTHSMGGLVARTLLSTEPALAPRITRMYLVGSPNAGSVKAIRTVIYGPDSLKAHATGFPGVLLNLVPTDVDQNVTKLTGITRPSLYELLPTGDPSWTRIVDQKREMVPDALATEPYRRYWPTADLEKRLFTDKWLEEREAEGRKKIHPADWIYCENQRRLEQLLADTRRWRASLGTLNHTSKLLTATGQATRLHLIVGRGVKTPSGVITEGEHDHSSGTYTFANDDGDGTVEATRVLESTPQDAANVKTLHGVPHGKLMGNAEFLAYFQRELAGQPMMSAPAPSPVR